MLLSVDRLVYPSHVVLQVRRLPLSGSSNSIVFRLSVCLRYVGCRGVEVEQHVDVISSVDGGARYRLRMNSGSRFGEAQVS